jgi:hypothetical protein
MRADEAFKRGVIDFAGMIVPLADDGEGGFGCQSQIAVVDQLPDLIQVGDKKSLGGRSPGR